MGLIGGKTLEFISLEGVANLPDDLKRYMRRIQDILEELNRRTYDMGQQTIGGGSGCGPYVAIISTVGPSYVHTANVYEWFYPSDAARLVKAEAPVLDLVEYFWSQGNLFEENDFLIVWKSNNPAISAEYIGHEWYGIGAIGGCPE